MEERLPVVATGAAALLAIAAFVTLFMQRPVLAGTLFVLTAFAIYVREKSIQNGEDSDSADE